MKATHRCALRHQAGEVFPEACSEPNRGQPESPEFQAVFLFCEAFVRKSRSLFAPSSVGREHYQTLSHRCEPVGSAVMYGTTRLFCAEAQLIRSGYGILAPQLF